MRIVNQALTSMFPGKPLHCDQLLASMATLMDLQQQPQFLKLIAVLVSMLMAFTKAYLQALNLPLGQDKQCYYRPVHLKQAGLPPVESCQSLLRLHLHLTITL